MTKATYSPNPIVHWRYDDSDPSAFTITIDARNNITVATSDGSVVDASFVQHVVGSINTTVGTDESESYQVAITMPRISTMGATTVVLTKASGALSSGEIKVGDAVVAHLSNGSVDWIASCRNADSSSD